jgi:regulator of protease activity HflC (stomatin/prohibitin superfamily)
MKRRLPYFLILVLTMWLLACSFFGQSVTIADNERGVVADDQGELQVLKPGTHVLSPFSSDATIFSLAAQTYTMTGKLGTGGTVQGDDAIEARSKDGRQLWIGAAVTYHFVESKLTDVRRTWQDPERFVDAFIRPTTRNAVYNTAGHFNYEEVISSKRSEIEAIISQQLAEEFAKQGVELVKFSLLDVRGE